MPRYFFHLHTEAAVETDHCGVEFACLEDAVADAQIARSDYLREEAVDDERARSRCRFEIEDEFGNVVAAVPRGDL